MILAVMNTIYATAYMEAWESQDFNGVEVLTFSGFCIRSCINCVHNCEDHSLLDLTSAVLYIYETFHISLHTFNPIEYSSLKSYLVKNSSLRSPQAPFSSLLVGNYFALVLDYYLWWSLLAVIVWIARAQSGFLVLNHGDSLQRASSFAKQLSVYLYRPRDSPAKCAKRLKRDTYFYYKAPFKRQW